jgi:tripartite-type tricarboxylate transporter receptor subunit TctC
VVPYAPGGAGDLNCRLWAKYFEKHLGNPTVTLNKPGGGAVIGITYVANAQPDGYTLLHVGEYWVSILTGTAKFTVDDLIAIQVTRDWNLLGVHPDAPWKTFQEFMDYAKKNPGMKYSHSGVGSFNFYRMENLSRQAKLNMTQVPFGGGSPEVLSAVMGKHIPVGMFSVTTIKSHIDAGTIRPLFSFDPIVKGVIDPKIKIPDFESAFGKTITDIGSSSIYLAMPKKTPKEVVHVIEKTVEKMCADPEFIDEAKTKMGQVVEYVSSGTVMEKNIPKKIGIVKDILKDMKIIK